MTLKEILSLPHLHYEKVGKTYHITIDKGWWLSDYTGDKTVVCNFTQDCVLPIVPAYPQYSIVTDAKKKEIENENNNIE